MSSLGPVNAWCDRLGLGYHVRLLDPVNPDIVEAGDFTVLALEDVRHDPPVLVSPHAVGYGIGQVLPIVVQTLLAAGDLWSSSSPRSTCTPGCSRRWLTCSPTPCCPARRAAARGDPLRALVLRLLRRVREGRLDPDDLAVLYVDLDDEGAAFVRRLEVDRDGDLIDGWPGSFFDERLEDVVGGRILGRPRVSPGSGAPPRRTVFGVSISAAALGDRADDPALRRAIHEELLEDLAVHGRLVFTSPGAPRRVPDRGALASQPPWPRRGRWC